MTAPVKRRRSRAPRPRLSAKKLAALRALVACHGCGAVRRDVSTGGTKVTHRKGCTAPPERAYDR